MYSNRIGPLDGTFNNIGICLVWGKAEPAIRSSRTIFHDALLVAIVIRRICRMRTRSNIRTPHTLRTALSGIIPVTDRESRHPVLVRENLGFSVGVSLPFVRLCISAFLDGTAYF